MQLSTTECNKGKYYNLFLRYVRFAGLFDSITSVRREGGDVGDLEVKSSAPQTDSGLSDQLHSPLASPGGKSLFYRVDSRLSAFLVRSELSCKEWYIGWPTRTKSLAGRTPHYSKITDENYGRVRLAEYRKSCTEDPISKQTCTANPTTERTR